MRKVSILLVTLTISIPALLRAQNTETIDTVTLSRIRHEALQNSQIPWIAHQLTDVAGPRLTNSPGWHHAADWIVKTLKDWGLSKAAIEPWGEFGIGWSAEKTSLSMRAPYYSPLIAYSLPWSGSTHGPISAPTFLVEQMDSSWVAHHLAQMKGKVLLLPAQDTTEPSPRWAIHIC
jgi:carboxypeptidase Q